jgi:NADH-quinone oxidoreductase subunit M
VLGQALMFHFSSEYFSAELKAFSQPLSALFAVGFFWSAVNFSSTKVARLRLFWLQQSMGALVAVGFFSLQGKGWHGAAAISFFQIMAIPFLLMVLGCHERREKIPLSRIGEFPMFALSSVTAILVGLFLPISLGFYGAFLVIWGLVDQSPWYMYLVVASLPILVLSGIQSMFFVLGETKNAPNDGGAKDFSKEEMLAILPIGIFLLFLGLIPKLLMDPIGSISLAMLKKIGMGE